MKQGIHAMTLNIDFDEPHHHRHASDILKMIDDSTLSPRVKARSKRIFEVIGHAEAKIHGMSFEDVHFHEVGAMDSIIDIIGGCIALESLDIDELYCSPTYRQWQNQYCTWCVSRTSTSDCRNS